VVATRCGGPEEFVTEASGRLIEVGDVDGLAEAIVAVGARTWDPHALAADAVAAFGVGAVADRLATIYEIGAQPVRRGKST
jgi:glycosyltransferase involved in cell wall biosynthesis